MKLPTLAQIRERLERIFALTGDGRLWNPMATKALFVAFYVGAVGGRNPMRPSTVLWMCDETAKRQGDDDRAAWYVAAMKGREAVVQLLGGWGVDHRPWYADNSREPLRDEIFPGWQGVGAMERDESGATTSSKGVWSLGARFANLFDPALVGGALDEAIAEWQAEHLGPVGRARAEIARQLAAAPTVITVRLPDGRQRELSAGGSSLILKGVIETFATRALEKPAVLFISESRSHVDVVDAKLLKGLGLVVEADRLLPDALLFDAGPGVFWFVEVVFSDGAITAKRKDEFILWSEVMGIDADRCRFLTAFLSRSVPPFRKLVPALAWGTLVWFLDEPGNVVRLEDLPERK
jgi:BsuBI/PstI restriction endonuclease domain/BsuBI/PstI restriction endonuclease HTH domain